MGARLLLAGLLSAALPGAWAVRVTDIALSTRMCVIAPVRFRRPRQPTDRCAPCSFMPYTNDPKDTAFAMDAANMIAYDHTQKFLYVVRRIRPPRDGGAWRLTARASSGARAEVQSGLRQCRRLCGPQESKGSVRPCAGQRAHREREKVVQHLRVPREVGVRHGLQGLRKQGQTHQDACGQA